MDREDVLNEFRAAGALLSGHFILSSGLHSPVYLQCARVMMDADRGARLCAALADKVRARIGDEIDIVASPALGGVIVGYEVGRQLGRPAVFFERVEGNFTLRRGFEMPPGARCLMAEDVVTTGLSSRECIAAIGDAGGKVVAGCCLIDRSEGASDIGVELIALAELSAPTYRADSVPPDLAAIKAVKPGSRAP